MRMIVRGWQRAYQDADRLAMSARHEMMRREADAAECIKVSERAQVTREMLAMRKAMTDAFASNPLVPKPAASKPPAECVTTNIVFADARHVGVTLQTRMAKDYTAKHGDGDKVVTKKGRAMREFLEERRGQWLRMDAFLDIYEDIKSCRRQVARLEARGLVEVRIVKTRFGQKTLEVMMNEHEKRQENVLLTGQAAV